MPAAPMTRHPALKNYSGEDNRGAQARRHRLFQRADKTGQRIAQQRRFQNVKKAPLCCARPMVCARRDSNPQPTRITKRYVLTAPDVTRFRLQDNEFDCPTASVRTGRFRSIPRHWRRINGERNSALSAPAYGRGARLGTDHYDADGGVTLWTIAHSPAWSRRAGRTWTSLSRSLHHLTPSK